LHSRHTPAEAKKRQIVAAQEERPEKRHFGRFPGLKKLQQD
jgi:hypothetical protein